MDASLRAGVAIYNDGEYHAAHDAWEESWLELPEDSNDARLLQGLIQFTGAVYHAHTRNWAGATGLARSSRDYLADLTDTRGVDLEPVRSYLADLRADPELIERADPPPLIVDCRALSYDDLRFEAAATAATVLAEEHGYDEGVLERGVTYARSDLEEERARSQFVTLVMDFTRHADRREIIYRRLREHVQRRRRRAEDVDGLFGDG